MDVDLEAWSVKRLQETCQELLDAQVLWESRKVEGHPDAEAMLALLDEDIKAISVLLEREKQRAAPRSLRSD